MEDPPVPLVRGIAYLHGFIVILCGYSLRAYL